MFDLDFLLSFAKIDTCVISFKNQQNIKKMNVFIIVIDNESINRDLLASP
jgi:hypothetical protein